MHELDELFAEKYDEKTPAVNLEQFYQLDRQKRERSAITSEMELIYREINMTRDQAKIDAVASTLSGQSPNMPIE